MFLFIDHRMYIQVFASMYIQVFASMYNMCIMLLCRSTSFKER